MNQNKPNSIMSNLSNGFIASVFIICLVFVGFVPRQSDFYTLLIPSAFSFLIYLYVLTGKKVNYKFWLLVALITKTILLFSFPNLSDDIYRFAWDGNLIKNLTSPYTHLPSDLLNNNIEGINQANYELLNSPNYFSVYPPINQLCFWIASVISGENIVMFSIVTKLIILVADIFAVIGIIKLLDLFKYSRLKSLIYALNPLLIIELNGNLHFEGVMISLFIWSLYFLYHTKIIYSAIFLALSIGIKLVSFFFIPLFLRYLYKKGKLTPFMITLVVSGLLMAIPLLIGIQWQNFAQSLDLYFQKFEFNASIYYLTRWLGKIITGYNQIRVIGPFLGLTSFGIMFYIAIKKEILSLPVLIKYCLITLSIYYLNTTTVHPWYMSFLVMLSVFTPYRYALVWSAMILLSYSHYLGGGYIEKYAFIGLEYTVVFVFIYLDFFSKKNFKV